MSLSSTCIKRPVFATVMNIIMMLVGCIGLVFLGVRDYPSVDPPIISVSTSFPGANADVIETQITEPLESAINGIPGIRSLTSQSRDGRSNITVEFELEVDLETAANDVRDKVSGAMRRLPKDVDPPTVSKADADAQPIFAVSLRSDQRSLIDLSMYADQYYKERLQTIHLGRKKIFRTDADGSVFAGCLWNHSYGREECCDSGKCGIAFRTDRGRKYRTDYPYPGTTDDDRGF